MPVRLASLLLPGCLLALAATACSGSSPAATVSPAATGLPASATSSAATGASSTGSSSTAATASTSATTGSTAATTSGGSGGAPATTTACSSNQLSVHEVSQQAATGHDQLVVAFDNTGSATCTLTGYPGLQLVTATGEPVPTNEHRGSSYTFPQAPVTTVTVAPGAAASFDIGYDEIPQSNNDVCEQAAGVAVTPPSGGTALRLSVSIDACQHGELDASPVVSGSQGVG